MVVFPIGGVKCRHTGHFRPSILTVSKQQ
jgi:hypothetical protein